MSGADLLRIHPQGRPPALSPGRLRRGWSRWPIASTAALLVGAVSPAVSPTIGRAEARPSSIAYLVLCVGTSITGAIPACSYPPYVSCRIAKPALAGRLRTQKPFLTSGYPRSTRPRGFLMNVIATCQAGILTDPHEQIRSLRKTPCLRSLRCSLWCRLSYHSPLHTRSSEAIPFMGSIPFRDRDELRS